jgi:hypothetical protein
MSEGPAASAGGVPDGEAAFDEFGFPVNFAVEIAPANRAATPASSAAETSLDLDDERRSSRVDDADGLPPSAAIEPATLDYAVNDSPADEPDDALAFDVVPADSMTGDRYGQPIDDASPSGRGDGTPDREADFHPRPPTGMRLSGPVDSLFGTGEVPSQDDAAADALASAFGGTAPKLEPVAEPGAPAPRGTAPRATTGSQAVPAPTNGPSPAPTRQAASELSLDHVFRETPRRSAGQRREAPAFSFDQFFSETGAASASRAGGVEPAASPTPAEGVSSSAEEGDIEQFNAWLEGLKKK